jgi:hypothetical protein
MGGLKRVLLLFFMFVWTFQPFVHALSWAYSFVVWKGHVYEVTVEEVTDIGKMIGQVKTQTDNRSGDYWGDASNVYPVGTKYYEIKGTPTKSAIAVEVEPNRYLKAVYKHRSPHYWKEVALKIGFGLVIVAIVFIVVRLKIKRS